MNQREGRGATRRSVVRAATGAAWSAPVIALATAVPAYAASPTGSLEVRQATYDPGIAGVLGASMTFQVCNNGTVAFNAPIVLTIKVPPISISVLPIVSGNGWSITSSLLDLANLGTITLVYNGALAPNTCAPNVKLQFILGVSIGSGRTATATGTDIYGHKVSSPSKSF